MNRLKSWFVYIVECTDKTFYTGMTTDIKRRINEHNEGKKGARYTRTRRPIKLVYCQKISNRVSAIKEEIRLKKLSRKKKIELIVLFRQANGHKNNA